MVSKLKLIRNYVNKSVQFNPRNNCDLGILQFFVKCLVSGTFAMVARWLSWAEFGLEFEVTVLEIEWINLLSLQEYCIYFQSTFKENTEEWFSVWRTATSCVTSVAVRSSYSLGGFISKQHISKATQTVFMDGWGCFLKCYCKYIWGGGII